MLLASCVSRSHIKVPYVALQAKDVIVFLEGAQTPEGIEVLRGDIAIEPMGDDWGPRWYRLVGTGRFKYQDSDYEITSTALLHDTEVVDTSLGGVILREDGSVKPIKPMKVIAR